MNEFEKLCMKNLGMEIWSIEKIPGLNPMVG